MSKFLLVSPMALGVSVLLAIASPGAKAQVTTATIDAQTAEAQSSQVLEQVNLYNSENVDSEAQVTNVSQFSDVRPGDWAYEALRQLVERYGCIAGYPNGTYRGNRAMTRYEFAAGLNACLRQIEKLIAASTADFATKEDLETLRRLIQEFQGELATLGTRVDKLEGRVAFLESHQFSTTTKLVGEAVFALTDDFGDRRNSNTVFGDRVRLDFQTSFTGKDKLHTRLAMGNLSPFLNNNGLGFEGTQTFDINFGSGGNTVGIDWLAYETPIGNSYLYISATGGLFSDFAPTLNPYFDSGDAAVSALSTFAQFNPIYRLGGGAGAGLRLAIGKAPILGPTSFSFGYLADNGNNPNRQNGLGGGDYAAIAQLNFNASDRFGLGLTYVHGYHTNALFDIGIGSSGVTGTIPANLGDARRTTIPGGTFDALPGAVSTNSYGVQTAFRLSNKVSLSGFAGTTFARATNSSVTSNIWYYGGGVAFPDLGKKGNLGGIFVGVEPYLAGTRQLGNQIGITRDRSLHIEGFYKYQLTDNIAITPGLIWITAPNQDDDNKDGIIGTIRTTFLF